MELSLFQVQSSQLESLGLKEAWNLTAAQILVPDCIPHIQPPLQNDSFLTLVNINWNRSVYQSESIDSQSWDQYKQD
jgi:hypothetical protein